MKREKKAFAALCVTATVSFAATAGAQAKMEGLYLGGSFGQATAKDFCSRLNAPGFSCDQTDTAWRVLGGYQINRNFAAELGYHDLGKAELKGPAGSAQIKTNAWELVGIGAFPLVDNLSVYGKLGFYRGEAKGTATFGISSASDTNTDFTYGMGVQYEVTRQLAIRAEYQKYNDLGGDDVGKSDVDVFSIGAVWRFQ